MINGIKRHLALSFFYPEGCGFYALALTIWDNSLRDGNLKSFVITERGEIIDIPRTFYFLDDHASLYSRDKRGREILRRPVLEREDKELIATVRLGETIYRGEVS
jgi:hypothetical protein